MASQNVRECLHAASLEYNNETNIWTPTGKQVNFTYSDGDASEEYVLSAINAATNTTVMSEELHRSIKDWPSTYHLHHQRTNLLRSVKDRLEGPILEIGAGCGILTRYMAEQGFEVVAVEGSPRRAATIAARCRDLNNVFVINANFDEFTTDILFKTVTLIGVLEYARVYFRNTDSNHVDPIDQLLEKAAKNLAEGGNLLLAIENQLGLKYFANQPEDHIGVPLVGIQDQYTPTSVVTFGRDELSRRLSNAGLKHQKWYYPFPDYKLPEVVMFEEGTNSENGSILSQAISLSVAHDRAFGSQPTFSMEGAVAAVARNGLLGELANSFLILASVDDIKIGSDTLAIYYGNGDRRFDLLKEVRFLKGDHYPKIERQKLISDNTEDFGIVAKQVLDNECFMTGTVWTFDLARRVLTKEWSEDDIADWARPWVTALWSEAGYDLTSSLDSAPRFPGRFLDAIPKNLVINDKGRSKFFDLEWHAHEDLDPGYLIFRGLWHSINGISSCAMIKPGGPILIKELVVSVANLLGFPLSEESMDTYWRQEMDFQSTIVRSDLIASLPRSLPNSTLPVKHLEVLEAKIAQLTEHIAHKEENITKNIAQLTEDVAHKEEHINNLNQELLRARRRPMRTAQKFIQFRALTFLSRISAPISRQRAARFEKSAAKRDPSRHITVQKGVVANKIDYENVLLSWSRERLEQGEKHAQLVNDLQNGPLISVVVPVYNPKPILLQEMIDSVISQSYPNWELCLADDCSTDKRVAELLQLYEKKDDRIKVIYRKKNGHISRATNSAIGIANGEFLALLDHDDLLDPDALLCVAKVIQNDPDVRIIYTDEDKVREDGSRYDPHFKPDWNRDLLHCINYISHLGVYEAALVREVGGLRTGFEGAQDHDLLLRCVEKVTDRQIVHVAKVLYSWRATSGSTAASNASKPYATSAGKRAVAQHLKRTTGRDITVNSGPVPFTYRANWTVQGDPLVSIIIPTRDHLNVLKVAVDSIISKTDYKNYELIIVDNGSVESCTLKWFDQIVAQDRRVQVRKDSRPFNYSALNNAAVAKSSGEFVALVNNDIEIISPGWLSEMVGLAQRPGSGCVGAKLYYPDGRIQHAGVVIGIGGVAGHAHLFMPGADLGYFTRLGLRQNYTAVTGACLVVRRSTYDAVGGLNEADLAIAFNDVDFCLKVDEAGFRNVWTPWAELVHHESISRGYEDTPEKQERFIREAKYMKHRWRTHLMKDPAYNQNLTLDTCDFSLAPGKWEYM